jgi:hypothetical protein
MNNHGFFEIVQVWLRTLVIAKLELVMTDSNHVVMLKRMLFDQLAIDVGSIGAIQIFKE